MTVLVQVFGEDIDQMICGGGGMLGVHWKKRKTFDKNCCVPLEKKEHQKIVNSKKKFLLIQKFGDKIYQRTVKGFVGRFFEET